MIELLISPWLHSHSGLGADTCHGHFAKLVQDG
jgi:hypothetical protein